MLKQWVFRDSMDQSKLVMVKSNKRPRQALGEVPKDDLTGEYEDVAWIDESQVEVDGRLVIVFLVNEDRKALVLSQRQAQQDELDLERNQKRNAVLQVRQQLRDIKDLTTLNRYELISIIKLYARAILALDERTQNLD